MTMPVFEHKIIFSMSIYVNAIWAMKNVSLYCVDTRNRAFTQILQP